MRLIPQRRRKWGRTVARVGQFVLNSKGEWETKCEFYGGVSSLTGKPRTSICGACGSEFPYVRGRKLCGEKCHEEWRAKHAFKRHNYLGRETHDLLRRTVEPVILSPEHLAIRRRMADVNWNKENTL